MNEGHEGYDLEPKRHGKTTNTDWLVLGCRDNLPKTLKCDNMFNKVFWCNELDKHDIKTTH